MNILITGGGGNIGTYLSEYLAGHSNNIFTLSRGQKADLQFDLLKITDSEISSILESKKIDLIIHCAGKIGVDSLDDFKLNSFVLNKFFINEAGRKKRYIVINSAAEYPGSGLINETTVPRPSTPYGESKLLQTALCYYYYSNFNIDVQVLRLFNTITPSLPPRSFIGAMLKEVAKGEKGCIKINSLEIERDFLDIRDFCRLLGMIIVSPSKSFLYNIASGGNVSYGEILNKLKKILQQYNLPNPEVLIKDEDESLNKTVCDTSKVVKDYKWQPQYSLDDSLLWCLQERHLL